MNPAPRTIEKSESEIACTSSGFAGSKMSISLTKPIWIARRRWRRRDRRRRRSGRSRPRGCRSARSHGATSGSVTSKTTNPYVRDPRIDLRVLHVERTPRSRPGSSTGDALHSARLKWQRRHHYRQRGRGCLCRPVLSTPDGTQVRQTAPQPGGPPTSSGKPEGRCP